MKRYIIAVILTLCYFTAFSQPTTNDVCIGVVCPESLEYFSQSGLSHLSQKMEQIATNNGVAAFYDGAFVMFPKLAVHDIQTVEGGMKTIETLKIDLTINVLQMATKTIVGSIPVVLSGSGYSIEEATSNAISKINARDPKYSSFLSDCKNRIIDYDEKNCKNSILKAKTLASQQRYEEALALLALYPESLPSYSLVSAAIVDIYKDYQKERSAQLVLEAKSAIAVQDYDLAANLLAGVDPESPSYREALRLIETVKKSVTKEKQDAIDRSWKLYNSEVALEKHRINAAREVAKAYYSNQPAINYTQIVHVI